MLYKYIYDVSWNLYDDFLLTTTTKTLCTAKLLYTCIATIWSNVCPWLLRLWIKWLYTCIATIWSKVCPWLLRLWIKLSKNSVSSFRENLQKGRERVTTLRIYQYWIFHHTVIETSLEMLKSSEHKKLRRYSNYKSPNF